MRTPHSHTHVDTVPHTHTHSYTHMHTFTLLHTLTLGACSRSDCRAHVRGTRAGGRVSQQTHWLQGVDVPRRTPLAQCAPPELRKCHMRLLPDPVLSPGAAGSHGRASYLCTARCLSRKGEAAPGPSPQGGSGLAGRAADQQREDGHVTFHLPRKTRCTWTFAPKARLLFKVSCPHPSRPEHGSALLAVRGQGSPGRPARLLNTYRWSQKGSNGPSFSVSGQNTASDKKERSQGLGLTRG